ncbi:MAG: cytochrome c peroxidase [bacterium]
MPKRLFRCAALGGILLATVNCGKKEAAKPPAPEAPQVAAPAPVAAPAKAEKGAPTAEGAPFLQVPLGLDTNLNIPADNPLTPEKIELGRLLYFDKRLSKDVTISCASCHDPKRGWTDNQPVSDGIHGGKGTRSAPTVINSTYNLVQFWDGRAKNLEEQALGPIINPVEMGMASHDEMVSSLSNIQAYRPLFQKAFGDDKITKERVAMAIASFERTVLGGNSKFDRYSNGDKTAMNESEIRGRDLFFGKANCTRCHVGSNFSDSDFHNLGVGMSKAKPDLGRYEISKEEKDKGAFKTPTVRDISRTAPYMHDGSVATLEEVVDLYDRGGEPNKWLDVKVVKLNLTPQEKADLVAFMKALDSDPYPMVEDPKAFPQ